MHTFLAGEERGIDVRIARTSYIATSPRRALLHPVLDVRLARGLSQQLGARKVGLALRLEPHGRCFEGFRWALNGKGQPPSLMLAASTAAVIVVLIGGMFFFRKMEATIADFV